MKYEEIRYFLFVHSYIGKKACLELRKKYGVKISKKGTNWEEKVLKENFNLINKSIFYQSYDFINEDNPEERGLRTHYAIDDVSKQLTPQIANLARQLKLNEHLLRVYILYNNIPKKLSGRDITFFATPYTPIIEMGHYIRIDKTTTKKELIEAYRYVKSLFKAIEIVQDKDSLTKHSKKPIIRERKRKDIGKDDLKKIKIFFRIENEIPRVIKDKSNEILDYKEDYKREIVGPAIERVVTKDLKEEDIKKERQMASLYKGYYYDIITRYNLPTFRDWTSIYGLISSKG